MPIKPKSVGGGDLEDSDMKGVSSLLKMKEGWRNVAIEDGSEGEKEKSEGLGFVLHEIDTNEGENGEEMENQASDGDSDGSSNGDSNGEGNGNGLIDNSKDPNKEKSIDDKDEYSIGDFIWGKIKSHPWWPGQIHDPSNASDNAMKLKQEGKFLVAYSGDGTFAWCASSQLRPFGDQFDVMAKQSSSRDFIQAVEAAVEEIGRFVGSKMTCSCFKGGILGKPIVINGGLKENAGFPDLRIEKLPIWIHQPVDLLTVLKTNAQAPNNASNLLEISSLRNWVSAFYRSKGVYNFAEYSDPKVIEGLEDPEDYGGAGKNQNNGPGEEEEWQKACSSSGNGRVRKRKQKSIAEIMQIGKTVPPRKRKVANLTVAASKVGDADEKEKMKGPVNKEDTEESEKLEETMTGNKGIASRERKRSKYLSSPYKDPTSKREATGDADKKKKKRGRKKSKASAKDVVFEIKSLAVDPDNSTKTECFPLVEQFIRKFRTSVNPENDNLDGERVVQEQKQKKRGRKGKNNGGSETVEVRIKEEVEEEEDIDVPIINLIGEGKKKKLMEAKKRKTAKRKLEMEEEEEEEEVEFVKKKLEDMSGLLEKSDGKLSKKVRSKLEGELKGILDKVASASTSST